MTKSTDSKKKSASYNAWGSLQEQNAQANTNDENEDDVLRSADL